MSGCLYFQGIELVISFLSKVNEKRLRRSKKFLEIFTGSFGAICHKFIPEYSFIKYVTSM